MPKWIEAKYPGDAVRMLMLHRAGEIGDIRIQHYGLTVKVGTFLPGETEFVDGDTPKTWPEKSESFRADNQCDLADALFDAYVGEAYEAGWQNYNPETYRG